MRSLIFLGVALLAGSSAHDQPARPEGAGVVDSPQRQAQALDRDGKGAEARVIWQRLIDNAADPKTKSEAQRRMAMSYGFEHNCAGAVKYEEMVIAYWVTREKEEDRKSVV